MNNLKHLRDHFVPDARNNYTPHVLRHRTLSLYAGLMLSVKLLSLFSLDLLPQNKAHSSSITSANILELTNYSRNAYGLKNLRANAMLSKAAQEKAKNMLSEQYFSHNSPYGQTPWDFIKAQGYRYIIAGENLAINFYDSESLENAWMNSPGHKANILNKDFEDIGIGMAQGTYKGVKAVFVVQMFGASAEQNIQTQLAYSQPERFIELPEVDVPVPTKIALGTPIVIGSEYSLTKTQNFEVRGYAPDANEIYVIVNNKPQIKLPVVNGEYSGSIILNEGVNSITAISFNTQIQASAMAKPISVDLDSVAPTVQAAVNPLMHNGTKEYLVEASTSEEVTKVVATVSGESIFLQPAANGTTWSGKFPELKNGFSGAVVIKSYDLAGNSRTSMVAGLTENLTGSYGFLAEQNYQTNILGYNFSNNTVDNFYLYFILFLLMTLLLMIVVKKNIQHTPVIAHASGIIMVALFLWST